MIRPAAPTHRSAGFACSSSNPTLPKMPHLNPLVWTVCLCLGSGSFTGSTAAPGGTEEPRPDHCSAHPAAGVTHSELLFLISSVPIV